MGFLIFFQFNFAHFSRTSNVKICIDRENSYWDDEFFSYYTRQIFCLDASFWYFSHLLICNFNAKLKLVVPPHWIKINEKLIGKNFLKIVIQSCKRYFFRSNRSILQDYWWILFFNYISVAKLIFYGKKLKVQK